jgi:hypothetical protein
VEVPPMPESLAGTLAPTRAFDHPAVKAWREIQPAGTEPETVEVLKESKKTAAYRLVRAGEDGSHVVAKLCPQETARVERLVYEDLFPQLRLPAIRYYGCAEARGKSCWLYFEDVGEDRYLRKDEEHRLRAAQWLATMHGSAVRVAAAARLPGRGAGYYFTLLRSSRAVIVRCLGRLPLGPDERASFESLVSQCELLQARWSQLERLCGSLPETVVHGDFVGKNVRVRRDSTGALLLLPFDWEVAGWGCPAADLAQFAGHSASPEIATYWATARQFWPKLSLRQTLAAANCGRVFRLLMSISWACVGATRMCPETLLLRLSGRVRAYEAQMAHALQTIAWG